MIEEFDQLDLETEHLQEVIETSPPAQPVVVIQYRTRGVPWYLVLTLHHPGRFGSGRFLSSRHFTCLAKFPTAHNRKFDLTSSIDRFPIRAAAPAAPLALNSLPISPALLAEIQNPPTPESRSDQDLDPDSDHADPGAAKTAGTGQLAKAASTVSTPSVPTPEATPVKQLDRQLASAAPADTTNRADSKAHGRRVFGAQCRR